MRVTDAYPARALNAPGREAVIVVEIETEGADSGSGSSGEEGKAAELLIELLDRAQVVSRSVVSVASTGGPSRREVPIAVPPARAGASDRQDGAGGARGYEVKVTLQASSGSTEAATALLAAEHWRAAPRYGFLSEFAPEDESRRAAAELRVRQLAKLHITIVQFYDWMYRHYDLVSDHDPYVDAMGRELSLKTVEHRIAATHDHGMAALAYGAVYGPEPEFIESRPEWLLYDSTGAAVHLIELFYITDLRANSGWREHIMREYEESIAELDFDGIHLDQYGFPKLAYDSQGALVDLADCFPGLIDEAARRVAAIEPGAGVIFNAVNDWPMDTVAASDQAAVYIEVWAPHTRYRDLVALARRARDLSRKQVILSAYLQPFREGGESAEWSLRYATAVIAAAGAHHLVMGEGDGVLRDPYYPNHGHLNEAAFGRVRRYYDHTAAYTHYLHALDLRPVEKTFLTGVNTAFAISGAKVSTSPEAGSLYVTCSQREGQFVLNLVNLTGLDDDSWDAHQKPAPVLEELVLGAEPFIRIVKLTWASPDEPLAGTRELHCETAADGRLAIALPPLESWATIVIDHR